MVVVKGVNDLRRGLGQLHGGRLRPRCHDPERLCLEHRTRLDAGSFGCRRRLGTASNLVMYVSAADNDYAGVTGTFLGKAAQREVGGGRGRKAALRRLQRVDPWADQFEGESVSVTDLLADSLALTGLATLDGLTAQGIEKNPKPLQTRWADH